jgi:hypothetical protein
VAQDPRRHLVNLSAPAHIDSPTGPRQKGRGRKKRGSVGVSPGLERQKERRKIKKGTRELTSNCFAARELDPSASPKNHTVARNVWKTVPLRTWVYVVPDLRSLLLFGGEALALPYNTSAAPALTKDLRRKETPKTGCRASSRNLKHFWVETLKKT